VDSQQATKALSNKIVDSLQKK